MGKCLKCSIEVLDEAGYCPLCRSVLEETDPVENMYPDARTIMQRQSLFSRIYLFAGILTEIVLIGVNVYDETQIWWSVIAGLAIMYGYMVLRFAILGKSGYRRKVIFLSVIAVLCAIAIDFLIGFRGWSVDFVLPAGILLMDAVILGCMLFNRKNWQSYIMWQLLMMLLSAIPAVLHLTGLEKYGMLAFMPMTVSAAIFAGTLIIGGHRAAQELARRFHVN